MLVQPLKDLYNVNKSSICCLLLTYVLWIEIWNVDGKYFKKEEMVALAQIVISEP
jgi:hypothetical protein